MPRAEAVAELKQTFKVLSDDIEEIRASGKTSNTPFAQRTLLRTHFAFVEGMSFLLRQVALATPKLFSSEEISTLREESYSLNSKGEIQSRSNFQKFLPLLLFTFRAYARIHGAQFEPDTSASGWQCMHRYKSVRDRLTHPKRSSDLELTDQDLRECMEASEWFKATLLALFESCSKADEHYRAKSAT